jgi:hypothetical protein
MDFYTRMGESWGKVGLMGKLEIVGNVDKFVDKINLV